MKHVFPMLESPTPRTGLPLEPLLRRTPDSCLLFFLRDAAFTVTLSPARCLVYQIRAHPMQPHLFTNTTGCGNVSTFDNHKACVRLLGSASTSTLC